MAQVEALLHEGIVNLDITLEPGDWQGVRLTVLPERAFLLTVTFGGKAGAPVTLRRSQIVISASSVSAQYIVFDGADGPCSLTLRVGYQAVLERIAFVGNRGSDSLLYIEPAPGREPNVRLSQVHFSSNRAPLMELGAVAKLDWHRVSLIGNRASTLLVAQSVSEFHSREVTLDYRRISGPMRLGAGRVSLYDTIVMGGSGPFVTIRGAIPKVHAERSVLVRRHETDPVLNGLESVPQLVRKGPKRRKARRRARACEVPPIWWPPGASLALWEASKRAKAGEPN